MSKAPGRGYFLCTQRLLYALDNCTVVHVVCADGATHTQHGSKINPECADGATHTQHGSKINPEVFTLQLSIRVGIIDTDRDQPTSRAGLVLTLIMRHIRMDTVLKSCSVKRSVHIIRIVSVSNTEIFCSVKRPIRTYNSMPPAQPRSFYTLAL